MSTSVHLTKPTAYRLLNQMVEDGGVMFYEELESNHPTRRVFSITPEGERAWQRTSLRNIKVLPARRAFLLLRYSQSAEFS